MMTVWICSGMHAPYGDEGAAVVCRMVCFATPPPRNFSVERCTSALHLAKQSELPGSRNRPGAACNVQLAVDARSMAFGCAWRDHQLYGNLGIGQSHRQELQHLSLAGAKR